MTKVGLSNFASSSQAPLRVGLSSQCFPTIFWAFITSGGSPGFSCWNVIFSGMTDDSGCSLIHPDPNEAVVSDCISSLETGIWFRDWFTTSDCNFINSCGLGVWSFPPHDEPTSTRLLTLSGYIIVTCWAIYDPREYPITSAFGIFRASIKPAVSFASCWYRL
jgi:hypothetical protein